jgi:uncharacterized protein
MEVARYWRTTKQRYELTGERCESCGTAVFPPRGTCPSCQTGTLVEQEFSGRGEVFSFSNVHVPPQGYDKFAPYLVALVRLAEGPLVTAQLTDVDAGDVYVGMPVEMITRVLREDGERGMLVYGFKFRPLFGVAGGSAEAMAVDVRAPEHAQAAFVGAPAR